MHSVDKVIPMKNYMPTPPTELHELIAHKAIEDVLIRYCQGVDRLDEALIRDVYWEDAVDNHGPFSGGRDEFIAWLVPYLRENFISMVHSISNIGITLRHNYALSVSYFSGSYFLEKDSTEYTKLSKGRYIDLLENRNGDWKLFRRTVVNDWARVDPITSPASLALPGTRDQTDPVYRIQSEYLTIIDSSTEAT